MAVPARPLRHSRERVGLGTPPTLRARRKRLGTQVTARPLLDTRASAPDLTKSRRGARLLFESFRRRESLAPSQTSAKKPYAKRLKALVLDSPLQVAPPSFRRRLIWWFRQDGHHHRPLRRLQGARLVAHPIPAHVSLRNSSTQRTSMERGDRGLRIQLQSPGRHNHLPPHRACPVPIE